jgi:putative NADPH-quinone reductase
MKIEKHHPLIIIGSSRRQSETKSFVNGIFNETIHKQIDLLDFNIAPYNYDGIYPPDDFNKLAEEFLQHNTIIFATPVYWYSMSAVMKQVFDRLTDLVTIRKSTGRLLKGKTVFLISVGNDAKIPEGFEIPFKNTAEYLDMKYGGCIYLSTGHEAEQDQKRSEKERFLGALKASKAL